MANAEHYGLTASKWVKRFYAFVMAVLLLLIAVEIASTNSCLAQGFTSPTDADNPPLVASKSNDNIYSPTRLMAVVGTEPILEADLGTIIDPRLGDVKKRVSKHQFQKIRQQALRQALTMQIQTKALSQSFLRQIARSSDPDEIKSVKESIFPRLAKAFHSEYVPNLFEQYEVTTQLELDAVLREQGSSLSAEKSRFIDQILANEAVPRTGAKEMVVTLPELRERYSKNANSWGRPARARWRQLSVLFSNHKSRDEAFALIVELGNQVLFGGAPFESVAKKGSEDYSSYDGGVNDWVSKDSLKSKPLDTAIFSIPLNRLSEVIEDEDGYHIIEVLEREEAHTVSFVDAQRDIHDEIVKERQDNERSEFTEKIMSETAIWSIYPEDVDGARPISEIISQR